MLATANAPTGGNAARLGAALGSALRACRLASQLCPAGEGLKQQAEDKQQAKNVDVEQSKLKEYLDGLWGAPCMTT